MLALLAKIMSYLRGLRRGFGWSTQPIIITPTPVVVPTLVGLSLTTSAITEDTAAGTFITDIVNGTTGSTLSLIDDGGGRLSLTGRFLSVGATNTDYETTPVFTITVRETLIGATNNPRDTILIIAVINANDTSPSAFAFTDVTNVSTSTTQTSNAITVAGLGASDSASAAVSGDASSLISKNGGSFVAGPVTVVNGDTVRVRHTSSGSTAATVNTTLTIGSTSDTFSSTTSASPALQVLTLFNSTYAENTAAGTVIGAILNTTAGSALSLTDNAGNKVAISGSNLTVGATNSNYDTVGGTFTCDVTETLGGAIGSPKTTTLTLTLTNLNDTNPSAFSFTDATGATVTTTETSNTITVAGLGATDVVTATLTGDASSQLSYNGGAWQLGPVSNVVNGDTFAVRHTSSASASTTVNSTLTIGTTADTYSSTTSSPAVLTDPVITQTSASGTNPPTWDSVMASLQDGDTIQLDFTSNGSSPDGTAEESQTIVATSEAITWSTFTGFASGATVKWRQRYGRTISGTPVWSAWSNTLSDVIATPAFTPASATGIKDYYKVRTAKLWKDTGGTIPVTADGDAVARWDSEMGVMDPFVQATGGNRPLYRANSGNPYLEFDGVNDRLTCGTTNITSVPQPFYEIAAVKLAALLGSQAVFDGTQVGQRANLFQNNIGSPNYQWELGAGSFVGTQGLVPTTNDVVIGGLFNGASTKGRIDQTDGSTVNVGTGTFAGAGGSITLGSAYNSTAFLQGRIYGFVLVAASPSSGDKTSISTWLAALQGRTI